MNKISSIQVFKHFFCLSLFLWQIETVNAQKSTVDNVNLLLGTWSYTGGVIPSVSYPFGMTQFCAMTRYPKVGNNCYVYNDTSYVIGFSATHQPAVWMGDYGYLNLMPGIGKVKSLAEQRKMRYSHKTENAKVYSYETELWNETNSQQKIKTQFTASGKCGFFQFTFPKTDSAYFIIEAINSTYPNSYIRRGEGLEHAGLVYEKKDGVKGFVQIDPLKNEITGYNPDIQSHTISPELKNFKGYFVVQFNKSFKTYGTWIDSIMNEKSMQSTGSHTGAFVNFNAKENEIIQVKIGTSFISIEQAHKNLETEIAGWDFEKTKLQTKTKWEQIFNKIQIETDDENYKQMFYTFMFRAHQLPREFSEDEKYYSAADDKIHKGENYTDFSLWDTHRALHPLLIYTAPERVNPMIRSLLHFYDESGYLPIWPNPMETNIMVGSHADAVIADAYVKGFRDYDVKKAYKAIRQNGSLAPPNDNKNPWADRDPWTTYEGRGGLAHYISKGYVAYDLTKESVARTLEYAYDDFCIAQMAKGMGNQSDYELFTKQSKNYKNLFDKKRISFMPRGANGQFLDDTLEGFTEGTYWRYRFFAPHDIEGMIDVYGGAEKMSALMDRMYKIHSYKDLHGNEQAHNFPFIYNYLGQSWKTQEHIYNTLNSYENSPWGIGNDDCGQMSAWFIFNSMGFYPFCPGTTEFAIGVPRVKKAIINLGNFYGNKQFIIEAKNISAKNKYIKTVILNGKELKKLAITHNDIISGGKLEFVMTDIAQK